EDAEHLEGHEERPVGVEDAVGHGVDVLLGGGRGGPEGPQVAADGEDEGEEERGGPLEVRLRLLPGLRAPRGLVVGRRRGLRLGVAHGLASLLRSVWSVPYSLSARLTP